MFVDFLWFSVIFYDFGDRVRGLGPCRLRMVKGFEVLGHVGWKWWQGSRFCAVFRLTRSGTAWGGLAWPGTAWGGLGRDLPGKLPSPLLATLRSEFLSYTRRAGGSADCCLYPTPPKFKNVRVCVCVFELIHDSMRDCPKALGLWSRRMMRGGQFICVLPLLRSGIRACMWVRTCNAYNNSEDSCV